MSRTLVPAATIPLVNASKPPGRSLIVPVKRHRHSSATKPFSITRLSTAGAVLPPQIVSTVHLPRRPGNLLAISAASGVSAAPSSTVFSGSARRKMANAIQSSFSATTSSRHSLAKANELAPP